jgi:hypothetical protein
MIVAPGGGGGTSAMYAVQIESLEEFQQKLTVILQGLEEDNNVMSLGDGASTFGDFPEGQSFASAYEQTKQDLVNTFNEVTQLVNTMINVAGSNASKYKQSEQDITDKFNSILQQYGDGPVAPAQGTTYYPATGGPASTGTTGMGTGTGTYYNDPNSTPDSSTDSSTDPSADQSPDQSSNPDSNPDQSPDPDPTPTATPQTYATQSNSSTDNSSSSSSNAAGNAA